VGCTVRGSSVGCTVRGSSVECTVRGCRDGSQMSDNRTGKLQLEACLQIHASLPKTST
jgi:hypothetical protein